MRAKSLVQNIRPAAVKSFLLINLGLILVALGIVLFNTPNNINLGGVSGLSILAARLLPGLDVATFMLLINVFLIIIGLLLLGKDFGIKTILSTLALSGYVSLFTALIPLQAPLTNDMMLATAFAVIFPSVGSALLFNLGASSGGTDIVALILKKYTSLETGRALLLANAFIVLGGFFVLGVETGLYCALGLIANSTLVDVVIDSINVRKCVTVVSAAHEAIEGYIIHTLGRGATVHKAVGAYSGEEKRVITTILNRRQCLLLRDFIKKTDPGAFLTIMNSSEIIGKGFRSF